MSLIVLGFLWLRGPTAYNVASSFCWLVASPKNRELGGSLQRDIQLPNFLYRLKDDIV